MRPDNIDAPIGDGIFEERTWNTYRVVKYPIADCAAGTATPLDSGAILQSWFISLLGLRHFAENKTTHQLRSFKQAALTALSWLDYSPASTQGAKVAYLVYREHTIVSSASQDEVTQQWLPVISISWKKENGRLGVQFFTKSQALCPKFRDAEKYGLERAKDWIDRKVAGLH